MDKHIDELLPLVRESLIRSAEADFAVAEAFGLPERDMAEIVVEDAIEHILRGVVSI